MSKEDSKEHYLAYGRAYRRFQFLPESIRKKYIKFVKAGMGLVEFVKLHDEGKLDKMTVIIIKEEVKKEQEEE